VYFDGTGDYLDAPASHSSFVLGTNNFTYECWFYPISLTGCLVSKHGSGQPQRFDLKVQSGYITILIAFGGTWGASGTGTIAITANEWHHVAFVRNGSSFSVFVNGVLDTGISISNASSISNNTTYPFRIGARGGADVPFNGYITDARLINGTALYTSNFTPPTAPLTAITNTSLLLSGTDASIIDKSQTNNLQLVGNTTGSTTQVKFAGSKSIYFDGSGDYITTTIDGGLGSGDFTIECWLNTNTITDNTYRCIFSQGTAGTYLRSFQYNNIISVWSGTSQKVQHIITNLQVNTWVHIAIVATSSNLNLYIDGSLEGSTSAAITTNEPNMYIGGWDNNSLNGYLQDFRITKGLARYTSNFTPPTAPLKG